MRTAICFPFLIGLTAVTGMAACGGSSTDANQPPINVPTAANASNVSIVVGAATKGSGAYSPNPSSGSFAVRPKIIWTNADRDEGYDYGSMGTSHRLISDTGLFDTGTLSAGTSYEFTFPAAGTYSYHCSLHPSMVGTITLTP